MENIVIRINEDLKNQFKAKCASTGNSMTTVLHELIKFYLEQVKK